MLKVTQNRIDTTGEKLLTEELVAFRPRRNTAEQIFNCCILIEKDLHHQQEFYHNFIELKKTLKESGM